MFSNIRTFFSGLTTDPAGTLISFGFLALAILISLILHECAHGWVALKCGDPTAKWAGRLTLDPRKHLDPIGTLCMVFLGIGWAKPVPINPNYFKNYRRDYILVSLAGIITNFLLFLISLFVYLLLYKVQNGGAFVEYLQSFFYLLAQINIGLAIFNLIPVPPLDGYRVLDEFVFHGRLRMNPQTMQIIQIGFLLICVSGLLSNALTTARAAVVNFFGQIFIRWLF